MRQGNGTELLGPNDPRSASIGIIYVSPNDDRKSVLAAILTQEKLHRKQILVVLPNQNKAFQRPQDFDDLRTIRRKLQAQIGFVAPSGPAEFARQKRFPVYSSLEGYAQALRNEEPVGDNVEKKGWFGRGKPKDNDQAVQPAQVQGAADASAAVPPIAVSSGTVATARAAQQAEDEEMDDRERHTPSPLIKGAAIAGGGALLGAGLASAAQGGQDAQDASFREVDDTPTLTIPGNTGVMKPLDLDDQEDWDALPPAAAGNMPVSPTMPARANGAARARGSAAANSPSGPAEADDDVPVNNRGRGVSRPADEDEDVGSAPSGNGGANEPTIIELPRRGARKTDKLPQRDEPSRSSGAVAPIIVPDPGPPSPPSRGAPRRRTTGKTAGGAAGVAGAAAAGAAVGSAFARTDNGGAAGGTLTRGRRGAPSGALTRTGGGGGGTPPQAPGGGGPRRSGSRRWWLLLIILLLLVLVVFGGLALAYMSPGTNSPLANLIPGAQPAATITITPDSKPVQDSYVIAAVTGTPNTAQHQVSMRDLSYTTAAQTKSVQATGQGHIPAVAATGMLTFFNGSGAAFTVGAGTQIDGNGVSVTTDAPAVIPAGNPGVSFGQKTVAAHALASGAAGNIGAGTLNQLCCTANNFIRVTNSAFSGGQDRKDYTFLQQSDVNGVINSLQQAQNQQAQNAFKGQIKPNEQLLAAPQCNPTANVDQPIGDKVRNIASANVTVTASCTGKVYDQQGVQTLVGDLLQTRANTTLGAGYALVGKIVTQTTVQSQGQNGINLLVTGQGVWVYKFSDAQQQDLKKKIAGVSVSQAQNTLKAQKGISSVTIQTSGTTLPTDINQITIVVQSVAGLAGGSTPPATNSPLPGSTSPASGSGGQITPVPGNGNSNIGGGS